MSSPGSDEGIESLGLPILGCVGIGILFFIDLLLYPTDVLFSPHSDMLASFLPQKDFLIGSWRETGELPLWNPYSFAGLPVAGDPESGLFYPPHMLLFLLPRELLGAGMSWLIVAHVVLAGAGGFLYARDQGLGAIGALVCGIGLMLSGKWMLHLLAAGHHSLIGFAWLPFAARALERSVAGRGSTRHQAAVAGCYLALLSLGSHPQWSLLAVVMLISWSAGAFPEAGGGESRWCRGVAWLRSQLLMLTVCGGLIAVQILPFLEMLEQSTRGVLGTSDGPWDKLRDHILTVLGLVGPAPQEPQRFFETWELRGGWGYLWLLTGLLAVRSPSTAIRRRFRVFAAIAIATVIAGFVIPRLPLLDRLNHPSRMFLFLSLPLAFLAGALVDDLARETSRSRMSVVFPLFLAVTTYPALLLGAAWSWGPCVTPGLSAWFVGYWVWALLATVVSLITLRGAGGGAASVIVASLLALDVWAMSWPHVRTISTEARYPAPTSVRALCEEEADRGRVLASGPFCMYASPLGFGLGVMRRVDRLGGYGPLDIYRYRWMLHLMSGGDGATLGSQILASIPIRAPGVLDTLGVKYLLVPENPDVRSCDGGYDPVRVLREARSQGTWSKRHVDPHPRAFSWLMGRHVDFPPYAVYENTEFVGRVFRVTRAELLAGPSEREAQVLRTDFRRTVLLEGEDISGIGPSDAPDFVRIVTFAPNRIEIETGGEGPGWLVLADPWYPGWVATIDGVETPVMRANVAMRAVRVPPGRHKIAFRFAPRSLAAGLAITIATIVMLLIASRKGRGWGAPLR